MNGANAPRGDVFYDIGDTEAAVRVYQEMLRTISQATGELPLIGVDGVYGKGTEEATRQLQAMCGLPVTGRVDRATWEAAAEKSLAIRERNTPPLGIKPFPCTAGFCIECGAHGNLVLLLQIVLEELSSVYEEFGDIPLTGTLDNRTMRAVRCFQKKNFLAENEEVNKETWDALARQYNFRIGVSE